MCDKVGTSLLENEKIRYSSPLNTGENVLQNTIDISIDIRYHRYDLKYASALKTKVKKSGILAPTRYSNKTQQPALPTLCFIWRYSVN
jgi:hypothetical protein